MWQSVGTGVLAQRLALGGHVSLESGRMENKYMLEVEARDCSRRSVLFEGEMDSPAFILFDF